mmetsp:Transcript_47862/g.154298  ORF Transcript_47862/g.154298 Transcript_47862/m.154298 type:complete len:1042 (+) Transcript_47862:50-3175(+)
MHGMQAKDLQDTLRRRGWEEVRTLGIGARGPVLLVQNHQRAGGEQFALKRSDAAEVRALQTLAQCRNIVVLQEHFSRGGGEGSGEDEVWACLEFLDGGSVRGLLREHLPQRVPEATAQHVLAQVLLGLQDIHAKGWMHRDIKAENICLSWSSGEYLEPCVRLLDFDVACPLPSRGRRLHEVIGTVENMAPEVFRGAYAELADCWSLGVVAFEMLFGYRPFNDASVEHVEEMVCNWERYLMIPSDATEAQASFLKGLLISDEVRMTSAKAARHLWLRDAGVLSLPPPRRDKKSGKFGVGLSAAQPSSHQQVGHLDDMDPRVGIGSYAEVNTDSCRSSSPGLPHRVQANQEQASECSVFAAAVAGCPFSSLSLSSTGGGICTGAGEEVDSLVRLRRSLSAWNADYGDRNIGRGLFNSTPAAEPSLVSGIAGHRRSWSHLPSPGSGPGAASYPAFASGPLLSCSGAGGDASCSIPTRRTPPSTAASRRCSNSHRNVDSGVSSVSARLRDLLQPPHALAAATASAPPAPQPPSPASSTGDGFVVDSSGALRPNGTKASSSRRGSSPFCSAIGGDCGAGEQRRRTSGGTGSGRVSRPSSLVTPTADPPISSDGEDDHGHAEYLRRVRARTEEVVKAAENIADLQAKQRTSDEQRRRQQQQQQAALEEKQRWHHRDLAEEEMLQKLHAAATSAQVEEVVPATASLSSGMQAASKGGILSTGSASMAAAILGAASAPLSNLQKKHCPPPLKDHAGEDFPTAEAFGCREVPAPGVSKTPLQRRHQRRTSRVPEATGSPCSLTHLQGMRARTQDLLLRFSAAAAAGTAGVECAPSTWAEIVAPSEPTSEGSEAWAASATSLNSPQAWLPDWRRRTEQLLGKLRQASLGAKPSVPEVVDRYVEGHVDIATERSFGGNAISNQCETLRSCTIAVADLIAESEQSEEFEAPDAVAAAAKPLAPPAEAVPVSSSRGGAAREGSPSGGDVDTIAVKVPPPWLLEDASARLGGPLRAPKEASHQARRGHCLRSDQKTPVNGAASDRALSRPITFVL